MKPTLTPWFPSTIDPVREGTYLTNCSFEGCNARHYFKDGQWYASRSLCVIIVLPLRWRGMTKEQK